MSCEFLNLLHNNTFIVITQLPSKTARARKERDKEIKIEKNKRHVHTHTHTHKYGTRWNVLQVRTERSLLSRLHGAERVVAAERSARGKLFIAVEQRRRRCCDE